MVHAMTALRKRKSLILDTCEIFVKEPLLDWVKDAKNKNKQDDQEGGKSD
jgi:DNA-dependent protein kinase catalytic subunit